MLTNPTRSIPRLAATFAALALAGCVGSTPETSTGGSKDGDADADPVDPTDGPTTPTDGQDDTADTVDTGSTTTVIDTGTPPGPTGDTGVPTLPAGLATLMFDAQFGIGANGNVAPINSVYGQYVPLMHLYFGSAAWTGDLTDTVNYCTIQFDTPTQTNPAWVTGDPTVWSGLDFDVASYTSTCSAQATADLDAAFLTPFGTEWGVAVGEVDAMLYPYMYLFAGYEAVVAGGRALIPPFDPVQGTEGMYSYAWAVDGGGNLIVNSGLASFIDTVDWDLGNNTLSPGLYFAKGLFIYQL